MNIIFLDIDGVLNSKAWSESETYKSFGNSVLRHFDPRSVELLNRLVTETNAKVVISSSWRFLRSLQELNDIFRQVGFKTKLYSFTPIQNVYEAEKPGQRGMEIQEWLNDPRRKNMDIKYAILDDVNDFLEPQQQYFFQTNPDIGLDTAITEQVIQFFK